MIVKLGPVPCQGCGESVYWTGSRWGNGRAPHKCAGPRCGALMKSRERCARRTDHRYEHRSRYALDNAARQKREGFAA